MKPYTGKCVNANAFYCQLSDKN